MNVKIYDKTNGYKIENTFNHICIWDFRMFADEGIGGFPEGFYKKQFPFIDYVILMTFTGGKGYNEWCKMVNGKLVCDFTEPMHILKNVLRQGVLPMIVIGSVPEALCEKVLDSDVGWGNCSKPQDYEVYYSYITEFAKAIKQNFPQQVYNKFRFRIGTEMDNPSWFSGNEADYLKLYDYTVDALCTVLGEDIYIGPSNLCWVEFFPDLLAHFANGKNYRTGKTGSKCDFLSFSYYEMSDPTPTPEFYPIKIQFMKKRLERYPQLGIKDLNVGEGQLFHDGGNPPLRLKNAQDSTEYGASWHAQNFDASIKNGVSYFANWAYCCDFDLEDKVLVRIPAYYTAVLCSSLKGLYRLESECVEVPNKSVGVVAAKSEDGKTLYVLCYHHSFDRHLSDSLDFTLDLNDFSLSDNYLICRIDKDHNNFSKEWLEASKNIKRKNDTHDNFFTLGSLYDTAISATLENDGLDFWNNWKKDYDKKEMLWENGIADRSRGAYTTVRIPNHGVAMLKISIK